jgi:hypothetical protein
MLLVEFLPDFSISDLGGLGSEKEQVLEKRKKLILSGLKKILRFCPMIKSVTFVLQDCP